MKRKEIIKSILLGILIITCIIQTTILWLGGIPGQNFFRQVEGGLKGIKPFAVWILKPSASNAGGTSSFAYQLDRTVDHTKRHYERLILELQVVLKSQTTNYKKLQQKQEVDWDKLFSMPSICYEYTLPLTIGEISGGSITGVSGIEKVDMVLMNSTTKFEKNVIIYFINTSEEIMYQLEVIGDFSEFQKIYAYFTREEMLKSITKYQPSAISNVKEYIRGNAFMPIGSTNMPIEYDLLKVSNAINLNSSYGMKELEKYVNDFFVNPVVKKIDYEEDGSVVFTEQSRNIVIYNPKGLIEYINLSPRPSSTPMTRLEGYNVAVDFINETDAIPSNMKENLYLSRIDQKDYEMTYFFDMAYEGYKVALSKSVKEALEIESLVEITIKNNQIINCSIGTLEFEPKRVGDETRKAKLKSAYVDPINDALETLLKDGDRDIVFEDTETVYLVSDLNETVYMTRGISLEGKWYYP